MDSRNAFLTFLQNKQLCTWRECLNTTHLKAAGVRRPGSTRPWTTWAVAGIVGNGTAFSQQILGHRVLPQKVL